MKKGEFEDCQKNGVKDIVEIKVGIDGLTIAQSKAGPGHQADAWSRCSSPWPSRFPTRTASSSQNPNKNWSDIDKSLPNIKIEVLGPPPTSGTRDSFHELFMESRRQEARVA